MIHSKATSPRFGAVIRRKGLRAALSFVTILVVWGVASSLRVLPQNVFPTPISVLQQFEVISANGILPAYAVDSIGRLLLAGVIGIAVAIPVGMVLGSSKTLAAMMLPFINFWQSIPNVAWLPIIILWIGFGSKTIVLVIIYSVFFPVVFNTVTGVRNVAPNLVSGLLVLGAKPLQVYREALFPGAMPNIVSGIRIGMGYAFRAMIAGEMIAGRNGFGYMIFAAEHAMNTARIIAGMIAMGAIWLFLEQYYLRPLERATIERWGLVVRSEGE